MGKKAKKVPPNYTYSYFLLKISCTVCLESAILGVGGDRYPMNLMIC